ncbi:phage tail assembly protein [Sphingomonas bisphenolicum]
MSDQSEIDAVTQPNNRFATIDLVDPIRRGDTRIEKLTLRKPKASELRGLTLQNLMSSDVGTIIEVVPRITDPILTRDEAENLQPEDLAEIGGTLRGFFMTASEKKAIETYIEGLLPKS